MDESTTPAVKTGDRIEVTYADKQFEVIVIDPDGLGTGQPAYGFGFRMAEKYIGIDNTTLSRPNASVAETRCDKRESTDT